MNYLRFFRAGAIAAGLSSSVSALACASCGCTIAPDWLSQGLESGAGTTLLLRYDYAPQTELRSGRHRVNRGAIVLPTDREIEKRTDNHALRLTLDHRVNANWAFTLAVPFYLRPHTTFAEDSDTLSRSRTNGLGDIQASARYMKPDRDGAGISGLEIGLKLPTGAIHQRFRSGPEAGEQVDRGLQPGAGSTVLVAGLFRQAAISKTWGYLLHVQGETPVSERDSFRPGAEARATAGLNYNGFGSFVPRVEMNLRVVARDRGVNSDRPNSGGELLHIAPGFSYAASERVSLFGSVQLPLYQRVNGYQLAPKAIMSAGAGWRF